jgi:hypothetical protein
MNKYYHYQVNTKSEINHKYLPKESIEFDQGLLQWIIIGLRYLDINSFEGHKGCEVAE